MLNAQKVIDETGAAHVLTERLGAGGQGVVWLTKTGKRVVKLLPERSDAEALRRHFTFVRRLDLAGLHVAKPIAVLRPPHVGYVAEFLGDMVPIKTLIDAPDTDLLRWHIETGGLRRRLRLLAHTGEALAGLHSRGVVYSDLSHNNVFVSEPVGALEAWLIDLDNLNHESDPARAIYTRGYGAPEVVAGTHGCTTYSDAWAFAVLVWQMLTLTHPFVGDFVNEGPPELESEAFAGKVPWVRHSIEARNACSSGLPPDLVMGDQLVRLGRKTFEVGLDASSRAKRTDISTWVDRLHAAADQTVSCGECGATYFVTARTCPWCEAPAPSVARVRIARWEPGKGVVEGVVRQPQLPLTTEGLLLPLRITLGHTGAAAREAHLELTPVEKGISVRAMEGQEAWVAPAQRAHEEQYAVSTRRRIIPPEGWLLFFEKPDRPQRVAVFGRPS
ncbi:MAG TPA: lipopolysaccharide kinase InaA family protein [Planctomycetota bacterium]|nr:lipopolysaccharide kinase InaA family protein [Planctomycetota bacterium]